MQKILLVEDDPLLIDIYATKLKQSGFEVLIVDHGEKALKTIREQKPDLVLLDVVLPNEDGWEILRTIKKDEELKETKVVVLSNLGQKEEVEKGLQLGAIRYLIKAHYTPSQVAQEAQNILGAAPKTEAA